MSGINEIQNRQGWSDTTLIDLIWGWLTEPGQEGLEARLIEYLKGVAAEGSGEE